MQLFSLFIQISEQFYKIQTNINKTQQTNIISVPKQIYLQSQEANYFSQIQFVNDYIVINLAKIIKQQQNQAEIQFFIYLLKQDNKLVKNVILCCSLVQDGDQKVINGQPIIKANIVKELSFKETIQNYQDQDIKNDWQNNKIQEINNKLLELEKME